MFCKQTTLLWEKTCLWKKANFVNKWNTSVREHKCFANKRNTSVRERKSFVNENDSLWQCKCFGKKCNYININHVSFSLQSVYFNGWLHFLMFDFRHKTKQIVWQLAFLWNVLKVINVYNALKFHQNKASSDCFCSTAHDSCSNAPRRSLFFLARFYLLYVECVCETSSVSVRLTNIN